jgi:YVTN family beta-propeller protein
MALMVALGSAAQAAGAIRPAKVPTNSSPIAISPDQRLVWTVNPRENTVAVIRTDRNTVVRKIRVGNEPRGIALDPLGRYAYVANAAAGTLTVIRILSSNPNRFVARVDSRFGRRGAVTTGAEPWNVVASPDGLRVFVANSGQDTITVLDVARRRILGHVDLRNSVCNDPDRTRHFQPRGMAMTADSRRLFVTRFLSFTRPGGRQADDNGKEGAVCRLNVNTTSRRIGAYRPAALITLAPRVTGFEIDSTGDGKPDPTSAFPNQLQSIVIRGNYAYLPNIAASPSGPLRFNVDTQAFVNVIEGVNGRLQLDSSSRWINLHLGARNPEQGKKKLFFANPWAIAFAPGRGQGPIYGGGRADAAYVVAAASDLLVKVNVGPDGSLNLTDDADTTRYIDLDNPDDPATAGDRAGKNPQGIVINRSGTRAYVQNVVSRNVSVVNLVDDRVVRVIRTAPLPRPGSPQEVTLVGAEVFFSSRGNFNRSPGATVSTTDRLSSEGWQACSSCHFEGLTDGVVWAFGAGPRKSVPLNGSFNPANPNEQRVLNYSAIFDEIEDFEANIRNVSGPGALAAARACSAGAVSGTFDPAHGLIIGDNGNVNDPPCTINAFALANANRQQLSVTLPGSGVAVPAMTALREWVRLAVRTPRAPRPGLPGGSASRQIAAGRALFVRQGCNACHSGAKWTISTKDFTSPPAAGEIATERTPAQLFGNPVGAQYLNRFLRDIGSFNLGVPGKGNPIGANVGGEEKAAAAVINGVLTAQDALGIDYNGDGKGVGYNVPSLLGIHAVPPYYHNGACESLACVVGNAKHRTANGKTADVLADPRLQAQLAAFLRSIDATTRP